MEDAGDVNRGDTAGEEFHQSDSVDMAQDGESEAEGWEGEV